MLLTHETPGDILIASTSLPSLPLISHHMIQLTGIKFLITVRYICSYPVNTVIYIDFLSSSFLLFRFSSSLSLSLSYQLISSPSFIRPLLSTLMLSFNKLLLYSHLLLIPLIPLFCTCSLFPPFVVFFLSCIFSLSSLSLSLSLSLYL